jgi:hypothetical protein
MASTNAVAPHPENFEHHVAIEVSFVFFLPPFAKPPKPPTPPDPCHMYTSQLSRRLNTLNPNDLLARRVISLALSNQHTSENFIRQVTTFGRFDRDWLLSLHSEILAHQLVEGKDKGKGGAEGERKSSQGSAEGMEKMDDGMVHDAEDVQAADPVRKGGLVRSEDGQVCSASFFSY